jgi:chemotaxis protein MotB
MQSRKFLKKPVKQNGAPAWMVTFADLVSLLLGFFIIMLSMSETKKEKFTDASSSIRSAFGIHKTYVEEKAPLNEKIVNAQFAQSPPIAIPASQAATVAAADAQAEEMQRALKALNTDVEVIPQETNIVIRLRSDAIFAKDQSAIQPEFLATLAKVTKEISKLNKFVTVSVHTDNAASADFRSLWDLSSSRASSVALALMKLGNLNQEQFTIVGHADTRPLNDNSNPENMAKNRRIEIVLTNEKP